MAGIANFIASLRGKGKEVREEEERQAQEVQELEKGGQKLDLIFKTFLMG